MKKANDFIVYALSHAKRESMPDGAVLPIDREEVGVEPWEYLDGTTGTPVSKELLEERYKHFYSRKGWTRESYDLATENWAALRKTATDCQGLLDSYLGTDVTANYCYTAWCTERGSVDEVERPYEIGEALFYMNSERHMTHVGFVCGFLEGEPVVVEARGIRFGVVVTRFSERLWTHRGLVTKMLSYEDGKKHPEKKKTYAEDFFEKFPKAPHSIRDGKITDRPAACRSSVYGWGLKCSTVHDCAACWNAEMEGKE